MHYLSLAAAGACVALATQCASAQTDQMASAHQAAANQLGILEYCHKQGYTDEGGVAAQKTVMSRLPASGPGVSTEAAEASGRQGTLVANGNSYTMASMASAHNTTEAALCKQMAANVVQVASMQQGSMGTTMHMPAMSGGMPQMPSGMPAVPGGMPAMPTVPQ